MSESAEPQFDDPALKGAVKGTWGSEKASPALRQQALMAMIGAGPAATAKPATPSAPGSFFNRPLNPWVVGAIAAIFAVIVGVWIYLDQRGQHPQYTSSADALPATVD